jgi:hypothetical protein
MAGAVVLVIAVHAVAAAQVSRFAQTNSRSQYVHWIELYDANERKIDPADPNAPPYSPMATCGKCHDYEAISHGFHFNAMKATARDVRPGEPWIWTDRRTGTQIPMSFRGWQGTYDPRDLGITNRQFVLKFGSHMPGGGAGVPEPADEGEQTDGNAQANGDGQTAAAERAANGDASDPATDNKWKQSGHLVVDCMFCHSANKDHNPEIWAQQIEAENFAWAPTAALGLGQVEGKVSTLPDDYDPTASSEEGEQASRLPRTTYDLRRFNTQQQVFFDIKSQPNNDACYYCHTVHRVGEGAAPDWTYDEDVHLRAGMLCVDCHRNGIDHYTVLGYEGEEHPSGMSVASLSCRGCHMSEEGQTASVGGGGRLGAPRPLHLGLPALHLEKMSCTSCHSGPAVGEQVGQVQTSKAHGLGLPSHLYAAADPPGIVSPVLLHDGEQLYPHRMMWPSFWATMKDDVVTPLNPEEAHDQLRRVLRVRRDFTEELSEVRLRSSDKAELLGEERARVREEELTEQEREQLAQLIKVKALEGFQEKLVEALTKLGEEAEEGATPVYISAGRAYRLAEDGTLEQFEHAAAQPHAWKIGHDVRPARWSAGATGCYECHSDGAPLFEATVTAIGPAPEEESLSAPMYVFQEFDKTILDAWNQSFQGRSAFKWFGFAAMTVVGLILLLYLLVGINGILGLFRRRPSA